MTTLPHASSQPRRRQRLPLGLLGVLLGGLLSGCGSLPPSDRQVAAPRYLTLKESGQTQDVVMAALDLVDSGYRFGGSNPEAGLDCSGMVSYVFQQAAGLKLPHNAARIAELTRPIPRERLKPGDLVFFETERRPWSHVGLYIGDGRFVHAPSSRGKVHISQLDQGWYAAHFQASRTLSAD